jgi:outer membrane protein OmpA-like peptidoglycan-associated protein
MKKQIALGWATLTMLGATGAAAQNVPRSPILDLPSVAAMRGEVTSRYDAALQTTLAPDVVRSNDDRYVRASEAKVACGIAIGYLKTNTVHPDSINKCDDFSRPVSSAPPAEAVALQPTAGCAINLPVPIFFDWNVDAPPAETAKMASEIAGNMAACGWSTLTVTGHADRSGSDAYNYPLSDRRARNVAGLISAAGVSPESIATEAKGESAPAVQTMDGIREPQNRRVEINAGPRS